MKKTTFYFSHDYNAAEDVKCLFLRQQLGMEGYGIFWYLIEKLANSGGILPLNITPVLAMQMQVPEVKVKAVIEQFELFSIIDNAFFSERLNEHLNIRKSISDGGKKGAELRWKNRGGIKGVIGGGNAIPNGEGYAKERKGKEIKINTNTEEIFSKNHKEEMLIQEMIKIFKEKNPNYHFENDLDYPACLEIAYKLAKEAQISKNEVVGRGKHQILEMWSKTVLFCRSDEWLKTRSLSDLSSNKEWQRLKQKVSSKKEEGVLSQKNIPVSNSIIKPVTEDILEKYRKKPKQNV